MAESRAQKLVTDRQFLQAAQWLSSRPELTQTDRILKAHVELEIGDSVSARVQAESLLKEHLGNSARAYCLDILGHALGRLGCATEGLACIQKAMGLTAESDPHFHADLLGHYLKALLSWVGVEPALAELPRLRRAALESGNRRALVEYHTSYARIAAIRGWWARAEAEIQVGSNLLEVEPCIDQLWRLRQVQATMAIKSCGLVAARAFSNEALSLAESIGSKPFIASTLANLAHIAALTGDYSDARKHLDRSLSLLSPLSLVRFALHSTEIDVGLGSLGTGDDDYAGIAVRNGELLTEKLATEPGYYQLWFELHRVRWLVSQHRNDEAIGCALTSLKTIETLADTNLLFRMRLLAAEALAKAGQADAAASLMRALPLQNSDLNLETIAEINRVAAIMTGTNATKYLARAWRILSASGLHGLRADVERTRSQVGVGEHGLCDSVSFDDPISIVESVALALQLGKNPRALGAQVLDLLRSLDLCEFAVLSEAGQVDSIDIDSIGCELDESGVSSRSSIVSFTLGTYLDRTYSIRARPRGSADRTMAWMAIEQILRSAFASGHPPPSTDDHITVWPSETSAHELGMIVAAENIRELVTTSRRLATSNITVLITGETGTGKELLARGIHDASPRHAKPFTPFNCSAVARDMLDAQLFGYRRGSFTGAQEAFSGVIRAASGGTLFLDEIGEISLEVQPKLLRFLESGEIHPLGEARPMTVDVRVVAATNAKLEQLVANGRFREDLFYRLNVVRLQVPPLRERREEIPPLVHHFLEKSARESHKTGLRVAEETLEYLVLYRWPGNVRQLANEVRRMVALAEPGAVLMPEHLSHDLRASRRTVPASDRTLAPTEFVVRMDQPLSAATEHLERSMVLYALKLTKGRLEEAAQLLGLSRKGLYLKRQRLGITEHTGHSEQPEETRATNSPAPPCMNIREPD